MTDTVRYYSRRRKKQKLRFWSLFLALALLLSLVAAEAFLTPLLRAGASRRARAAATYLVSAAVCRRMNDEHIRYGDMIVFEKNDEGLVTALSANMTKMNDLKARLSLDVLESLSKDSRTEFSLPLGSLTRSSFLMGKGPAVRFRFVPTGDIASDFRSEFSSGGINQTCHRIYLDVTVGITVLLPIRCISEEITTSVCVAETVIVGAVPDAFTNVQNIGNADDEISGDVVDFGANNFLD